MRKKHFALNLLLIWAFIFIALFTGCEKSNPTNAQSGNGNDDETPPKSTITEETYLIVNRNSGKLLEVPAYTDDVIQNSYLGGANQKWIISGLGDNYYRLSPSSNTDNVLDVAAQSTENGANVLTSSFSGGNSQQWLFTASADSECYSIINRNSGKALDIFQSSTEDGANVVQWDYWDTAKDQQWYLKLPSNKISWTLTTSNIPSNVKTLITAAMDAAVARYNLWGDWPIRTLTVEYNTDVPTADGNINGNIRFGANITYMNERTALHEMGHTYGVGTSSAWGPPLIINSVYVGKKAASLIKTFDGPDAEIHTDHMHFWPYGLNYNNEMSEVNADRHVQIVWAMAQDGLYPVK